MIMERLLIIEDNYMMRLFLVNYLDKNFWVDAVATHEEGLQKLEKSNDYAVVLSDVPNNPENTGHFNAALGLLKSEGKDFVLLTSGDKSEDRIHAMQLGAIDALSKPFNPLELELRIRSVVKRQTNKSNKRVA